MFQNHLSFHFEATKINISSGACYYEKDADQISSLQNVTHSNIRVFSIQALNLSKGLVLVKNVFDFISTFKFFLQN